MTKVGGCLVVDICVSVCGCLVLVICVSVCGFGSIPLIVEMLLPFCLVLTLTS